MEKKSIREENPKKINENKQLEQKLWVIFKFILGLVILLLISCKIFTNDIFISINNIDYTILLSFLLAFFSIVLSMMFYFKSNDSSNQFYDNTYKFTKDISTILGRIEAGFGEKLQNLDKGYSGLLDRMDKNPTSVKDIEETKIDKKEVEQSLRSEIKERNQIIQTLIEKSQLEQKEKEEIKQSLFGKEKAILKLERELRFLQRRLENQKNNVISEHIPDRLKSFLRSFLLRLNLNPGDFNREKAQEFISQLIPSNENDRFKDKLYIDLIENDIVRENGNLTNKGYTVIRHIVRNEE